MNRTGISILPLLCKRGLCSQAPEDLIVVEKISNIVTIGINRPTKRNCVNTKTATLLKTAVEQFENDDSVHAGVLHGIGGNFCAGFDLEELAHSEVDLSTLIATSMGPTKSITKKPLVAAVNGYAVAGGLELALMCDLRVVEENAILGMYNRRFGVPLIDGGTVRLTAVIGLSRTLDLILTGRSLEAKEALEWGLANRIVACGTALGQAINLALCLTKFPQKCLLQDRNSVYNSAFKSSFTELLEYERQQGASAVNEESIEGAKKFMSGIGRHGKTYNLTERETPLWEQKESEFKP